MIRDIRGSRFRRMIPIEQVPRNEIVAQRQPDGRVILVRRRQRPKLIPDDGLPSWIGMPSPNLGSASEMIRATDGFTGGIFSSVMQDSQRQISEGNSTKFDKGVKFNVPNLKQMFHDFKLDDLVFGKKKRR